MDRHRKFATELPYSLRRGLVAYWPMATKGVVDLKSHLYVPSGPFDLTNNNTVTRAAGPSNNLPDAAAMASASSQYFSLADKAVLRSSVGSWTFVGWFRTASAVTAQYLVTKWNGTGNQRECIVALAAAGSFSLQTSPDGTTTGATTNNTVATYSANTDYFVEFGYDNRRKVIFFRKNNGAEETFSATQIFGGTATLNFGALQGTTTLNGRMAHWGRWNRTLSNHERAWLYNAGKGRDLTRYL